MIELKNDIINILDIVLGDKFVYDAVEGGHAFGKPYLKIWAACSNKNIHGVQDQKPQMVSLVLYEDLELKPQVFGGMGGQSIYRKPDMNNPKERFLAMASIKVPFRKPQPVKEKVLNAITNFFNNYKGLLRLNKDVLRYQDIVDYDEILKY